MQRAVTMATLLKRSDASLYRVFLGLDCATFVQRLTQEHCFEIHAVLHAPSITTNAHEQLDAAIHGLGTHRGNAWFEASLEQAVKVFLTVLPMEAAEPAPCIAPSAESAACVVPSPEMAAPAERGVESSAWLLAEAALHQDTSADPAQPAAELPEHVPEPAAQEESDDTVDMDTNEADPLWSYVQACPTREATKCVEIRAALTEKVGKAEAQKLLARTKPTVAQDSSGKKIRVLKLGGSLLKLK